MSKELSKSQEIWNSIKDKNIDIFSLTKKVSDYFSYVDIDANKCHLEISVSAALPALETTLGPKYACGVSGRFVVVEQIGV